MNRAYRFSLRPTSSQEKSLFGWLCLNRELYNAALEERSSAYRITGKSPSRVDQEKCLPEIRSMRPEFSSVPIAVLRGTLRTLDRAFNDFFRRCKSGKTPGYPRFKGRHRFNTIAIDDVGKKTPVVAGGRRVAIPLIGKIRFKQHRPIEGSIKALRITHRNGKWIITFFCTDVPAKPMDPTSLAVGIDLGIKSIVTTSDGEVFDNPHALRSAQQGLAKAQRRVSRRKSGSNRRRKAVRILARGHAHVANVRREEAIKTARFLTSHYDAICIEDLNVKKLSIGRLSKSMHDAAWGIQLHWLHVKAEEAGCAVVKVDPRGTSQECSGCGEMVRKELSVRVHNCPHCGLVIDRDVNAAINIKTRGLRVRGGMTDLQSPMIREVSKVSTKAELGCDF